MTHSILCWSRQCLFWGATTPPNGLDPQCYNGSSKHNNSPPSKTITFYGKHWMILLDSSIHRRLIMGLLPCDMSALRQFGVFGVELIISSKFLPRWTLPSLSCRACLEGLDYRYFSSIQSHLPCTWFQMHTVLCMATTTKPSFSKYNGKERNNPNTSAFNILKRQCLKRWNIAVFTCLQTTFSNDTFHVNTDSWIYRHLNLYYINGL